MSRSSWVSVLLAGSAFRGPVSGVGALYVLGARGRRSKHLGRGRQFSDRAQDVCPSGFAGSHSWTRLVSHMRTDGMVGTVAPCLRCLDLPGCLGWSEASSRADRRFSSHISDFRRTPPRLIERIERRAAARRATPPLRPMTFPSRPGRFPDVSAPSRAPRDLPQAAAQPSAGVSAPSPRPRRPPQQRGQPCPRHAEGPGVRTPGPSAWF